MISEMANAAHQGEQLVLDVFCISAQSLTLRRKWNSKMEETGKTGRNDRWDEIRADSKSDILQNFIEQFKAVIVQIFGGHFIFQLIFWAQWTCH